MNDEPEIEVVESEPLRPTRAEAAGPEGPAAPPGSVMDRERPMKPPPPQAMQWLRDLVAGEDPTLHFRKRGDYCGASMAVVVLLHRGLIDENGDITQTGRELAARPDRSKADGRGE